ncbi:hypothetical protein CFC21_035469, partial [Triticum aestivum]|jgi:hypothetical protein
MIA